MPLRTDYHFSRSTAPAVSEDTVVQAVLYNPTHVHRGMLFTGLSSVMILKLPSTYGREYSNDDVPQNGRLQILGAANGQFAKIDYQPPMDLRDFYVFPYDMRHCVYPFNGTNETRRTLAANCDVHFDPIKNRGAI